MIGRFIASQFRKPSGLLGRLLGNGMARGNEPEARWTVDLLNIQPDTRILEIGFGPGMAIQYAAEQAAQDHVSGIDYSETMVQVARKRNASAIRNGLIDLTYGDVRSLPYIGDPFACLGIYPIITVTLEVVAAGAGEPEVLAHCRAAMCLWIKMLVLQWHPDQRFWRVAVNVYLISL